MAYTLITGAHGFIGRHLAKHLAAQGHTVIGLGHGTWSSHHAQTWGVSHWFSLDLHIEALRSIQQQHGTPDVVYHLAGGSSVSAAIANPREDFLRTVCTTAELLEWIRLESSSIRLICISSAAVYGAGHHGFIGEDAPLNPYSPYGYHKWIMEGLCKSYSNTYGIPISIARLFSVFGPELRKQLLWDACSRMAAGESPLILDGTGHERRDWTDVRDVVQALEILSSKSGQEVSIINIGTGVGTSVQDMMEKLMTVWHGCKLGKEALAFSGKSRPGDPFSLVSDPHHLNELGFQWTRSLTQSLTDYVTWFRTHMMDKT